ncbi:MauE/DoxX family redox-associated membrane protein [Actinoplanes sp. NPDC049118]|uniref:MauE/DoxX family redox-associated membrane protein n=1 Tax=Actinoplanes sp. NPDC049118 TaxID=3155769 RepID=UPI0033F4FFF7
MITSAGNRNPANADGGGAQRRVRAACFTGQACLELPMGQRNRAVAGWLARYSLPMVAVAAVYAAFGVYTAVLRVRRPGVPCGCFGGSGAVSWGVVARAWAFCISAAVAAPALGADAAAGERLAVGCAAILVALIAWLVPQLAGLARPVRAGSGVRRG